MSVVKRITDIPCSKCGHPKIETHMKDPFIDDMIVECEYQHCDYCVDGEHILSGISYGVAKEQSGRDHDYKMTDYCEELDEQPGTDN